MVSKRSEEWQARVLPSLGGLLRTIRPDIHATIDVDASRDSEEPSAYCSLVMLDTSSKRTDPIIMSGRDDGAYVRAAKSPGTVRKRQSKARSSSDAPHAVLPPKYWPSASPDGAQTVSAPPMRIVASTTAASPAGCPRE